MTHVIFLIVILALTACTITREPTDLAINTDTIAGYWSGKVAGNLDTGQELHQKDVGILIITGCTIGNVCGKFAEDDQCPEDIILLKVDGNRYTFISASAFLFITILYLFMRFKLLDIFDTIGLTDKDNIFRVLVELLVPVLCFP